MSKKLVCLDAGHGLNTGGKRTPPFPGTGVVMREWQFNSTVIGYMEQHLKRCGFEVMTTLNGDTDVPLATRTGLANNTIRNTFNRKADYFVSVHCNAFTGQWTDDKTTAQGISTHIQLGTAASSVTYKYAEIMQKWLMKGTPMRNRGIVLQDLHITRVTTMPATLLECGFMDNLRDATLQMTDEFRRETALECAYAICEMFGVAFVAEDGKSVVTPSAPPVIAVNPPAPAATIAYRVRKSANDSFTQAGAFSVLDNAKAEAKKRATKGYKVFDASNNLIYDPNASQPTATQPTTPDTPAPITPPVQPTNFLLPLTGTPQEKADKILALVTPSSLAIGLLPSVRAAQLILESGWITSQLSVEANNGFGMKQSLSGNTWAGSVWDGKTVLVINTREVYEGKETFIDAPFRKYPRLEDSIADHSAYLLGARNGSKLRYEGITAAKDYRAQIQIIKDGGYATDPEYVNKVCKVIEQYKLDRNDKKEANAVTSPTSDDKNKPSNWATDLWEFAIKEGWTDGSRPKDTSTREEVAGMLHNALTKYGVIKRDEDI